MTRIRAEAPLILLLGICAASLLTLLAALMEYEREDPATTVANKAFENEEYEEALNEYEKVSEDYPNRPEPDYNSANALYRLEDYEQAEEELDRALGEVSNVEDEILADSIAASTQFNLGNVLFQKEEYEEAIEAYKQVLRDNPDDEEAKHNLELALRQQQQQQEEQQQQQQQEEQQQGQGDQPGPPDQPDDEGDEEQEGPDGDREGVGEDPEGEQRGDGSEQESPLPERPGSTEQQQMTPAQALQFLEAVGQNTDTLQSYLQRQFAPTSPPERDW